MVNTKDKDNENISEFGNISELEKYSLYSENRVIESEFFMEIIGDDKV